MPHDVDYYRQRGFDRRYAEYFAAGRRKIISVTPSGKYELLLLFDDGQRRRFNVEPLIEGGTVFEILQDKAVFDRVYLDGTNSVCWDKDPAVDSNEVWSNKVDISADTCYVEGVEC